MRAIIQDLGNGWVELCIQSTENSWLFYYRDATFAYEVAAFLLGNSDGNSTVSA